MVLKTAVELFLETDNLAPKSSDLKKRRKDVLDKVAEHCEAT